MAERAPRGPAHFRQGDVTRAILAAEKAGKEVVEICIAPDGTVRIITSREKEAAGEHNEWDDEA